MKKIVACTLSSFEIVKFPASWMVFYSNYKGPTYKVTIKKSDLKKQINDLFPKGRETKMEAD
jgi:hypothetical protein